MSKTLNLLHNIELQRTMKSNITYRHSRVSVSSLLGLVIFTVLILSLGLNFKLYMTMRDYPLQLKEIINEQF